VTRQTSWTKRRTLQQCNNTRYFPCLDWSCSVTLAGRRGHHLSKTSGPWHRTMKTLISRLVSCDEQGHGHGWSPLDTWKTTGEGYVQRLHSYHDRYHSDISISQTSIISSRWGITTVSGHVMYFIMSVESFTRMRTTFTYTRCGFLTKSMCHMWWSDDMVGHMSCSNVMVAESRSVYVPNTHLFGPSDHPSDFMIRFYFHLILDTKTGLVSGLISEIQDWKYPVTLSQTC
jgi:hypothetical protein